MKKITLAIAAILAALFLYACGGGSNNSSTGNSFSIFVSTY